MPLIPPGRLDEIERRILSAEAPADFVPTLAKEWTRSTRQLWKYVALVRKRLAERAKAVDPEADRETVRAMVLDAYRTARKGGESGPDAKGMVAAAKLFADITGSVAPKRFEHSGPGGKPIETRALSAEALSRRITELAGGPPGEVLGGKASASPAGDELDGEGDA